MEHKKLARRALITFKAMCCGAVACVFLFEMSAADAQWDMPTEISVMGQQLPGGPPQEDTPPPGQFEPQAPGDQPSGIPPAQQPTGEAAQTPAAPAEGSQQAPAGQQQTTPAQQQGPVGQQQAPQPRGTGQGVTGYAQQPPSQVQQRTPQARQGSADLPEQAQARRGIRVVPAVRPEAEEESRRQSPTEPARGR